MTDRELLELAAKAAGMTAWRYSGTLGMCKMLDPSRPETTGSVGANWNPLTDDGDAQKLAVKLRMSVRNTEIRSSVLTEFGGVSEPHKGDPYAATRRAIVRAAAEIGRNME